MSLWFPQIFVERTHPVAPWILGHWSKLKKVVFSDIASQWIQILSIPIKLLPFPFCSTWICSDFLTISLKSTLVNLKCPICIWSLLIFTEHSCRKLTSSLLDCWEQLLSGLFWSFFDFWAFLAVWCFFPPLCFLFCF